MKNIIWKKILSFVGIFFIMYGFVFLFGVNDKRTNQVRLSHNGVSTNSMIFPTKSTRTIKDALKEIEILKNDTDEFQIQFILSNNIIYIYGNKMSLNTPLINGRNFYDQDFDSKVPFAIVGSEMKDKLYSTTLENYLVFHGHYISIIGTTGLETSNSLNKKSFISVNSKNIPFDLPLNKVLITGDGPKVLENPSLFQKIFHSKKELKYLTSELPLIGSGWLKNNLLIIISFIILTIFLILIISIQVNIFKHKNKKYRLSIIFVGDLIITGCSLLIGIKTQYIINYPTLIFLIFSELLFSIIVGRYLGKHNFIKR